jgi:Fur family transcriptional regulator, peroxide stress response regulator
MDAKTNFQTGKYRELLSLCQAQGLSLTSQRKAILAHLAERVDHPTADQIYDALREQQAGLSRTTVYRVLDTFVHHGLVKKIACPDARSRFDANTRPHTHLICIGCQQVMDGHQMGFPALAYPSLTDDGFAIEECSIVFLGRCARCRELSDPSSATGNYPEPGKDRP